MVRNSRCLASGDAGILRQARWRRQPHRVTCTPAPVPNSASQCRPLGNPNARWVARSRVAPASAPSDGDNGAPRWRRLCPASGCVDHWPCSRLPWLSTTGTTRGGGEGGAMPGRGEWAGTAVPQGGGRRCNAALPSVLIAVRQFLRRGLGSFIRNNG
jgi:hypothetical protein